MPDDSPCDPDPQRQRADAAVMNTTPPVKPRVPHRKPAAPVQTPAAAVATHPADASPRSSQVLDGLLHLLPSTWRRGARDVLVLMRMDRPVGALLLLWPTWWALWLARRDFPPVNTLLIFTAGVFLMRAAGCVINDYADRWLDPQVERTRGRPLAAGRISPRLALLIFSVLMLMAFALVLLTNALTIKLSLIGAGLATLYPFTKRYTHLPQVVLGAAFGWSIPMAFAAVNGNSGGDWQHALPPLCWLLFLANVLWATIYDTEYAMVDREEDIQAGAKSTAILFGDLDLPVIGMLMVSFIITMLMVGSRAQLHWSYFVAVGIAAALFVWQHWILRDRSREHCFAAFRNNQWVGLCLWVGICMAVALR